MYKIIVADDEIWLRQRLAEMIPWEEVNAEIAGVAENGQEALELVKILNPDIVITDIRMPGLSGIELMRSMKILEDPPKVIVLSGYSDFSYAKEAIQYGAFDYILKPVEDEDLLNVVKQCIVTLALERDKKRELSQLRKAADIGFEAWKEKILLSLLKGEYSENSIIIEKDAVYSPNMIFEESLKMKRHVCVLVHIDGYERLDSDRELNCYIVKNIMSETLSAYGKCEFAFIGIAGEMSFILSVEKTENNEITSGLKKDLEMIKKVIKEKLSFTISIAIGKICDDFWNISYTYDTARMVMKHRKWLGADHIYDDESISLESRNLGKYSISTLSALLRSGKLIEAENEVRNIYERISKNTDSKNRTVTFRMAATDIVEEYYSYLINHTNRNNAYLFRIEFWDLLDILEAAEEFLAFIRKYTEQKSIAKNKFGKISKKAMDYIALHYMEPVSLNDVAGFLELNPSYFCRVFKDETGISFISCLQNYRIEQAIELMRNETYKIYEIGNMVGYENQQYFNKVFKSVKGISPAVYREKLCAE